MEFKKVIRKSRQLGILAGISFLALLCSVWNIAVMKKDLSYHTREYCVGITTHIAKEIRDSVDNKKAELLNVADAVSGVVGNNEKNGLNRFFRREIDQQDFDAILMVNEQGACISGAINDGMVLNVQKLAQLSSVKESFSGQVNMGFFDNQTLFYSAPVFVGEECPVVLVGVRSRENMQSMIASKAFYDKTLSCIIDSNGEVILSPTDLKAFLYLDNIFKDNSRKQTVAAIRQMQEDIRSKEDGVIHFLDVNNNHNMLAYNNLGINDWILLTIVPENLFSDSVSQYTFRSILIIGGISLCFLAYLMTIYCIYTDNRNYLSQIAFIDPVTGGMNNKAFQLQYQKNAAEGKSFPSAIVLLNVVNFKRINEKFGFAAGNEILSQIYQGIKVHLDEQKEEFAARGETDHFFLCMREKEPQAIQERLDRLVREINDCRLSDSFRYQISFTAGCCLADGQVQDIHLIQDRARIAIQSKNGDEGKWCVFYDEEVAKRIEREQETEEQFEEAVIRGDFAVYLQPKVSLITGKPEGAEALIRWNHPKRGLIPPSEFVPLFERTGRICQLDFYVFQEICRFYERRRREGKKWYPVSVNLSRYHFYEEAPLEQFYQVYKEYGLAEHSIEFELTESMFFDDEHIARLKKEIRKMHELGIRCSMDDFGFGYSSLGLLREFDVDTLKLDRSFFLDMSNEKAKNIIQSIVELAVKLEIETVAEGIEEAEQVDFLYSINCDKVQGYYFSRPLPMDEFERWVGQYEAKEIQNG